MLYKPQLTQHYKKYTRTTQPKMHSLYKFSSQHVAGWCQKKNFIAPFLDSQKLHYRSTGEANVYIFLFISVRKLLFQSRKKILSVRGGYRISLRWLAVWSSWNVLNFFILIWTFRNLTIFQHFDTSINSIETMTFSRQFGAQR